MFLYLPLNAVQSKSSLGYNVPDIKNCKYKSANINVVVAMDREERTETTYICKLQNHVSCFVLFPFFYFSLYSHLL